MIPFRHFLFKFAGVLFFCFYFSCPVVCAENSKAFPSEIEFDLTAGATSLYHLQFKAAEDHFRAAMERMPDHPAPYFFITMLRWYQLSYDSLEHRDLWLEKILEDQANQTIKVAKRYAKNPEAKAAAYLYQGGALGAKGWYHVTRGQWVRAYFDGKKGYSLVKKSADFDPELYDAYLGIGMYEYYAATLGPTLRALASFSVRGDKETAVKILELVEHKGKYVNHEASYFLWNSAMDEGRLGQAHKKIQQMVQYFPNSPLFKWCEIQTLFYQKKWVEVIRKSEEYIVQSLRVPDPNHLNYSYQLLLSKVYYHCGAAYFNINHIQTAEKYFDRTIAQNGPFIGWRSMAYLRRGELFDLDRERDHALECYRKVLELPNVWNSHKLAKERIKKPFTPEEYKGSNLIHSPLEFWRAETEN